MLKIGICDMDTVFTEKLMHMLTNILCQYTDWEAQIYQDSKDVIQAIDETRFDCNLLFMDIYQKDASGVVVAEYVDAKNVDVDIIFVTASDQHVFECYKYHTFAYLLKPLQERDIAQEVKRYLEEMQMNPRCFNISSYGNVIRIPISTILYVESNYRKIIVHTKTQAYEYYEKMDHVEDVLRKEGFIRCHQSYLVALDKITTYNSNVLMVDEHAVPISRKYKTAMKEAIAMSEIAATAGSSNTHHERSYLTTGLFQQNDTRGALVCVKGAYLGKIIRIVAEQEIIVGRDGTCADMIVNLPLVSRKHCVIIYHEKDNQYEVTDYSSNGTFVDGDNRLVRGDTYLLQPGTTISFGDKSVIYKLG